MAQAAEKEKPKIVSTRPSFMFRHGEKLALGVAAGILVGYGAFSAFSGDEETLQAADSSVAKVKQHTEEYKKKVDAIRAQYKDFDSRASWTAINRSTTAPKTWTMALVSKVDVIGREPDKPKVTTVAKLPEIEIESLDSILGAVTGTFKFTLVTARVIDSLNKIDAARLTAFKVERRTLDDKAPPAEKAWAEILKIPYDEKKPVTQFADKTIRPKTKYEYRMISMTDQKGYERETEVLKIESPAYSEVKALRTVGYFSWRLGGITSGTEGNSPKINIEIVKYDAESNDSYKVSYGYTEGEVLGSHLDNPTAEDPKVVFDWEAKGLKSNQKKKINFNTGAKLVKLESGVRREIPYRVCKVVGGACQGLEFPKRPYTGNHILIVDDEGEKQETWRPEPPKIEDRLCPDHAALKGTPIEEPPKSP